MANKSTRLVVVITLILLLASVFRLYNVSQADVITDEALNGFRSIGYIDFFVSPYQTTPFEWFSEVPTWAKISFHDHPPLVFLIQHFFFNIFGVSNFSLRLPFVLAGIASVYLVYLIAKEMFGYRTGIIASLLLAVSTFHVWISRIGLQESIVILFSLLSFYYFIQSFDKDKHWRWGIFLGLAILSKYTALILLPIFFIYFLVYKKEIFTNQKFWLAISLVVFILSPIFIYNINLYKSTGHFDLQLSYIFGQDVPEWDYLPGKLKAGSLFDRTINFFPNLYAGFLAPMFLLLFLSMALGLFSLFKNQGQKFLFLIILTIILYLASLLLTGLSFRFMVAVVPFVVILMAWFLSARKYYVVITLVLLIIEGGLAFNSVIAPYPRGVENITYSRLRWDSYRWGYSNLNNYINNLLQDKKPTVSFQPRYLFLDQIKRKAFLTNSNRQDFSGLIIYDANMYDLATLWIFHRQLVYEGWPVITAQDYLDQSHDYWLAQGVKEFYFFKIIDEEILQQPGNQKTNASSVLAENLDKESEIIKRPDGREVFAVYHWQ